MAIRHPRLGALTRASVSVRPPRGTADHFGSGARCDEGFGERPGATVPQEKAVRALSSEIRERATAQVARLPPRHAGTRKPG